MQHNKIMRYVNLFIYKMPKRSIYNGLKLKMIKPTVSTNTFSFQRENVYIISFKN